MKTFKLYSYFFPSSYNFLVYVLTNFTSISTLVFFSDRVHRDRGVVQALLGQRVEG